MRLDLPGKTVAITGAGGGLGAGLARALRAHGANVALLDLTADARPGPSRPAGRRPLRTRMGRRRPRLRSPAARIRRDRQALRRCRRRHRRRRRPRTVADDRPDRSRRLGPRHRHQPQWRLADAEGRRAARPGNRRAPRRGLVDDRLHPPAATRQLRGQQGRGRGHGRRHTPRDARRRRHRRHRPPGHLPHRR